MIVIPPSIKKDTNKGGFGKIVKDNENLRANPV